MSHSNLVVRFMWENADVHTLRSADQTAYEATVQVRSPMLLHAMSNEDLRNAVRAGILNNGFDRVSAFQHINAGAGTPCSSQILLYILLFCIGKIRLFNR